MLRNMWLKAKQKQQKTKQTIPPPQKKKKKKKKKIPNTTIIHYDINAKTVQWPLLLVQYRFYNYKY